jgi:transcriptional regulator with XRE-family HTH domain
VTVDIPISPVLAQALGIEFAKARLDAGVTQLRVAEVAQVSAGYVSQLEAGRLPAYTTLRSLCRVVKVSPMGLAERVIIGPGAKTLKQKAQVFVNLCLGLEEVL